MATELMLTFETETAAQANQYAADLAQHLKAAAPAVDARQRRTDPNAQDFGASIVLILGAPAVVALAKGIADWLRMSQTAKSKLVIRDKNRNTVIEIDNARSSDLRALLEGKLGDAVGR